MPAKKKKKRFDVKKLGPLVAAACRYAELLFPEKKSGEQKKEWVVELLNKKLNVPLLTEKQEAVILGLIVDVVCDLIFGSYRYEEIQADELFEILKQS